MSNENLMVNLDTGVRIEIREPSSIAPLYGVTINMCGLAYFGSQEDALEAFNALRDIVKPSAKIFLSSSCKMPDPFSILGLKSPFVRESSSVGGGDWLAKAKELGIAPEEQKP